MSNYLCNTRRSRLRMKGVSLGKRTKNDRNTSFLIDINDRFRITGVSLEDAVLNKNPEVYLPISIELNVPTVSNDILTKYEEPIIIDVETLNIPNIIPTITQDEDILVPPAFDSDILQTIPDIIPIININTIYLAEEIIDNDLPNLYIPDNIPVLINESYVEYKVFYNGNGSTGGTVPVDNNWYRYDAVVTLLENTGSLVKTGYTWLCWNTKADGTGIDYNPVDIFNIYGLTTIYAKWI